VCVVVQSELGVDSTETGSWATISSVKIRRTSPQTTTVATVLSAVRPQVWLVPQLDSEMTPCVNKLFCSSISFQHNNYHCFHPEVDHWSTIWASLPQWKPKAVAGTNWTAATCSTCFGMQRYDLKKLTVRRLRDRATSYSGRTDFESRHEYRCSDWDFSFFPQILYTVVGRVFEIRQRLLTYFFSKCLFIVEKFYAVII
jgi:hypothetical protein